MISTSIFVPARDLLPWSAGVEVALEKGTLLSERILMIDLLSMKFERLP